jgi:hypothetical protein
MCLGVRTPLLRFNSKEVARRREVALWLFDRSSNRLDFFTADIFAWRSSAARHFGMAEFFFRMFRVVDCLMRVIRTTQFCGELLWKVQRLRQHGD